ncbi:MAG: hypothetical protein HY551_04295, partial [Elusimicrobia bacterium]|nr:hypothetical protein [Elusimicrobiota bacterium]
AALASNFEKMELWAPAKARWEQVLRHDERNAQAKISLRTVQSNLRKKSRSNKKAK